MMGISVVWDEAVQKLRSLLEAFAPPTPGTGRGEPMVDGAKLGEGQGLDPGRQLSVPRAPADDSTTDLG